MPTIFVQKPPKRKNVPMNTSTPSHAQKIDLSSTFKKITQVCFWTLLDPFCLVLTP